MIEPIGPPCEKDTNPFERIRTRQERSRVVSIYSKLAGRKFRQFVEQCALYAVNEAEKGGRIEPKKSLQPSTLPMSLTIGRTFRGETVTYYGTGTPQDPSPLIGSGTGACGMLPTNSGTGRLFAVSLRPLRANNMSGSLASETPPQSFDLLTDPLLNSRKQTCLGSTVVEIIDSCSCSSAPDHGSIAISVQGMADLLGGSVDRAKQVGVVRDASWSVVQCPVSFGRGASSPLSFGPTSTMSQASIMSSVLPANASSTLASIVTTSGSNSNNNSASSTNIGPLIGGVAAGVMGLIVTIFVVWLRARLATQQKEDADYHVNAQFVNSNRNSVSAENNNRARSNSHLGTGARLISRRESRATVTIPTPEPQLSLTGIQPLNMSTNAAPAAPPVFLQSRSVSAPAVVVSPVQSFPFMGPTYFQPQQYAYPQEPVYPPVLSPVLSPVLPNLKPEQSYPQQLQPSGKRPDYSQEWAVYFQQHPDEYVKYYGSAPPRE
ncbi:hypothetical protein BC830DRAFT_1076817 [Chytriomyces sp. MP71]|nr:hypothetical protein BC830DRAFT_1076817 [Chytriomyces sp. MP71]